MSQQDSSVQADRSAIGALAAFLSTGAAASLGLFPVLMMQESFGMDGFIGWALALVVIAAVAGMTTKPLLTQTRNAVILVGCVLAPLGLIFAGKPEMGGVLLGVGLVGSAFVIPMVEWALGLSEGDARPKSSMFQFSSGAEVNNPIPSSLILGVLVFAWPGELLRAGWVAAPYLGFLLMMASLGGMFSRVRESSAGVVAVHPKFLTQWFITGVIATVVCAGIGFLVPLSMGDVKGFADQRLGGPVKAGPMATRVKRNGPTQDRPDYDRTNPNGFGDKKFQEDMPAPSEFRPGQKSAEETKNQLIKLIALALVAAVLLWVSRKYQKQILVGLKRFWSVVAGPFVRAWQKSVANRKRKKHEAAVNAILAQLDDPYADPPASLRSEDLGPLYEKMVADLALLGAKPKPDESALAFVRRVATVYPVDKESLFYLGQVMTEATFSPRPVANPKLETTRDRFVSLRKQIHGAVAEEKLPEKQAAYRWAYAESKLSEAKE